MTDEPTREPTTAHFGEPTHEWCPDCNKNTVDRTPIYALAATGPRRIGEWALCQECNYSPYEA